MSKHKITAGVVSQEMISDGIYSLWIEAAPFAADAVPGQFISLYCAEGTRLLPRPISLCEIDKENGRLHLVYRVAGKGTEEFSALKAGDTIEVLGPLGNGFPLTDKKAVLVGGGIGVPPMLQLAKSLDCEKVLVMGYRTADTYLEAELAAQAPLYIATDDGSKGTHGTVVDALRVNNIEADVLYACGPTPMLRALKAYAEEKGMTAWISMEEKMACGIGACLACVCQSKDVDEHSHVHNKRVCKEGPVFNAKEVEL